MPSSRESVSRRTLLRSGGVGFGLGLVAALEGATSFGASAQTPSADEVNGSRQVTLAGTRYVVSEGALSATFAAADSDLTWEIVLPDLVGLPPGGAPLAVFGVRRAGDPVSQISMQWGTALSSFRVTFSTGVEYTSLFYPDLSLGAMPVVLDTPTHSSSFLVDVARHSVTGGEPRDFWRPLEVVGNVASMVAPLRAALLAVRDTPEVGSASAGEATKQRCESSRKWGWIAAVAGLVAGMAADATGGVAVVTIAIAGAVAEATGEGATMQTEHRYKECTEAAGNEEDQEA